MKLNEIISLHEELSKEKQKLMDILYRKSAGSKISDKIGLWIWNNLVFKNDEITPQNAKIVEKYLSTSGFSKKQIHDIRDLFTKTTKVAIDQLQKKYGKEVIPDKYISAGSDWFGVYQLYLNIAEEYHIEFKKMVKKLFLLKIEKLGNDFFIPENA